MVFFFKQKTAYEMRISDWSSDVCSSDLERRQAGDRAGMIGRDLRRAVELGGGEESRPVDARRLLREIVLGPDRRRLGEILALFARRMRLGDLHLQIIDTRRLCIGVGDAGSGPQLGDRDLVVIADGGSLGVGDR